MDVFDFVNFKRKKAAIYTRVSTMEQVKGTSLETQLEICRKMCEMKNYELVDVFTDPGVSGTIPAPKREEFGRFLKGAEQKKFDVLVFYCFDRLAREIRVFLGIVDELRKYNIKIVSCRENIDTATDSGDFMMNIYASVSNLELRTMKARLSMGKLQTLMNTGYSGGLVPYAYKAINKIITIDKDKAKIVKEIFKLYKKGLSLTKIAEILTASGIPPPRNGKRWYSKGVGIIIKNREKYRGGLMNNNKNGIKWPKII